MKRAFTLIELLVVIAIIAILAAILFPVFAQAKMSAKAAASLSNNKQIILGELMYSGDVDDYNILDIAWNTGNDPVWFGSAGTAFSPWSRQIQPYIKNLDLTTDPTGTPNTPNAGWGDLIRIYWPQYGYNSLAMCPTMSTSSGYVKNPKSQTSIVAPADTIAFTSHFGQQDNALGAFTTYWYGPLSILSMSQTNVPVCDSNTWYNEGICFYGASWGTGSYIAAMLKNIDVAGAFTGGGTIRPAMNMVVTMADGHAKKMRPGNLAIGSSFAITQNQSLTVFTDKTKYIWDAF